MTLHYITLPYMLHHIHYIYYIHAYLPTCTVLAGINPIQCIQIFGVFNGPSPGKTHHETTFCSVSGNMPPNRHAYPNEWAKVCLCGWKEPASTFANKIIFAAIAIPPYEHLASSKPFSSMHSRLYSTSHVLDRCLLQPSSKMQIVGLGA